MNRVFIYGLIGFLGLVSPVFAGSFLVEERIPDYVNEGTLTLTRTCDSGATQFHSYDINDRGYLGWGMTIVVNDKIRYYIYSPNPNSMSPITWTFAVGGDGSLEEISRQERDANLKTETPNLYALLINAKNDCTHEKFSN